MRGPQERRGNLYPDMSNRLFHIDENSVILLISTEGDTDPDGYRRVVE